MADSENHFNESDFFTFIWTIENACDYCAIYSPEFTVKEMDGTEWKLMMHCFTSNTNYVLGVELLEELEKHDGIDVKCEFSFLGTNGLPLLKGLKESCLGKECLCFFVFDDESCDFNKRREGISTNGTLTVCCRISILEKEIRNPHFCYGHTVLRMEQGSFIWKVGEFSSLKPGQKKTIVLNPTAKEEFQRRIRFFIKEENGEQWLCIKKKFKDKKHPFCVSTVHAELLDATGQIDLSDEVKAPLDIIEKRTLMANKASLLPNDVLSIRYRYKVLANVLSRIEYHSSSKVDDNVSKMKEIFAKQNETSGFKEDMKGLFLKGTFSDVNLQAGSMSIPAHKGILSARSKVFEALFNGDMKEKTDKCFEIPDIDEDTMRRLLYYIYTDSVEDLQWQQAAVLYRAANKYELLDLKKICSTVLKSNVAVGNVCIILVLGDMHQDQDLLEKAQDFIKKQDEEFFESETWRSFKEEYSKLAFETMEKIILNIKGCFYMTV